MIFILKILIFLFNFFILHYATEIDNCCRYGFEDGVKLSMLNENKKWSVIRSKNFNYCESKILFGVKAFRLCKSYGEEIAMNCQIGKYNSLQNVDCDSLKDYNLVAHQCCKICSNGKKFAEETYEVFDNKTIELGEEIYQNQNLYKSMINDVENNLIKRCGFFKKIDLLPVLLKHTTFSQCCYSFIYNYNQNFYPKHFNVNDTCNRINVCLDDQSSPNNILNDKTKEIMKIINKMMKIDNVSFEETFDEIRIEKNNNLPQKNQADKSVIKNKLRSLQSNNLILNKNKNELIIRKVPYEKIKYIYCNKACKNFKFLDYNEKMNLNNTILSKKQMHCFRNGNSQFCAKPLDCDSGKIPNINNTACVELNECKLKIHDCLPKTEYCLDYADGYICECKNGYKIDHSNLNNCININECEEYPNSCPSNSTCKDLDGSYDCICKTGFLKDKYGHCLPNFIKTKNFTDKTSLTNNELTKDEFKQLVRKTPINSSVIEHTTSVPMKISSIASFLEYDPCPQGFYISKREPKKCLDIDECSNINLNNCNFNETCINLPGKFECKTKEDCPPNYKEINLNLVTGLNNEQSSKLSTYVFLLILACFIIFILVVFVFAFFVYRRFSTNVEFSFDS